MAPMEPLPGTERELEKLLPDSRFGPPAPDEATPWDFVLQWTEADLRARVWPTISRLLLDDDDRVRERALEFIANWHDGADVTTQRLLEVAEQHLQLFAKQAPDGVPLREKLARALANRARVDGPRVAAILRRLASDTPVGGGAATVLGMYEPGFVTAQAARWEDRALTFIDEAAQSLALFRRDAVLPFLRAVRHLSEPSRSQLLATIESAMKRDDAVATFLPRSRGLPSPTQPAPSDDECRRVVGLA